MESKVKENKGKSEKTLSMLQDYTNISSSIINQLLEIPETELKIMVTNVAKQNLITLDVDVLMLSDKDIEQLSRILQKCSTRRIKKVCMEK